MEISISDSSIQGLPRSIVFAPKISLPTFVDLCSNYFFLEFLFTLAPKLPPVDRNSTCLTKIHANKTEFQFP